MFLLNFEPTIISYNFLRMLSSKITYLQVMTMTKKKIPCELFYLKPIELVEAKLYTLQKIRIKESEIIELEHKIKEAENVLWLTTDFQAEGCTNETTRKAFVNQHVKDDKDQLDWLKIDLSKFYDDLELIKSLMEVKTE